MQDDELPKGLTIRTSAAGTPSFQFSYNWRGQRYRQTLESDPRDAQQRIYAIRLIQAFHVARRQPGFNPAAFFPPTQHRGLPTADTTVRQAVTAWIERAAQRLRPCTVQRFGWSLNWYGCGSAAIADVRLADLSPAHLRNFIAATAISRRTLRVHLQPLRGVIEEALEDGILAKSPLAAASVRKLIKAQPDNISREIDPFTEEEMAAIYRAALGESANFAELALLGFHSGLRESELLALSWEAVDSIHGTLHINCGVVDGHVDEPKNRHSKRDVQLREAALGALQRAKAQTFLRPEGRVFINPRTNKAWESATQLMRIWRPVLKRAGVRYRNPYQMRHSYISHMLRAGEDPAFIQRQVGHANLWMIQTTYGRYIDEARGRKGAHLWRGSYGGAAAAPAATAAPADLGTHGHTVSAEAPKHLIRLVK
jgi:integrase